MLITEMVVKRRTFSPKRSILPYNTPDAILIRHFPTQMGEGILFGEG